MLVGAGSQGRELILLGVDLETQFTILIEVLEKLKSLAFVPAKESRQEFEAYIALENVKWGKIIKDAGVKIE